MNVHQDMILIKEEMFYIDYESLRSFEKSL